MFGILYGLFCFGAKGVGKAQQAWRYEKNRQEAIREGRLTYTGKNGDRLVSNNRSVWKKNDLKTGHEVIADLYTGEIYHDLTKEKQKQEENKALSKGETVVMVDAEKQRKLGLKVPKDVPNDVFFKYLDIKTHKLLTTCYVNHVCFYIDINGHLIRMVDRETGNRKIGNLNIQQIIYFCNKRQIMLPSAPDPFYESYEYSRYIKSRKYLNDGWNKRYLIDDNGNFIVQENDCSKRIVNY